MKSIRIALAQINPVVGDLSGNVQKIISYIEKARALKVELIAFPELAITGYPPEDLLLKPQFVNDNINALDQVKAASNDITAIVGFVDSNKGLFNAAAVISNNRLIDVYHKKHLPNYGVFDEYRYFLQGRRLPVYDLGGIKIGVNICEDIWYREPTKIQAQSGAEIIININASPYHIGKVAFRENLVLTRVSESGVIIAYVNMVGGQDELVFDGASFVVDRDGKTIVKGVQFEEELIPVDIEIKSDKTKSGKNKAVIAKRQKVEKIKIHHV